MTKKKTTTRKKTSSQKKKKKSPVAVKASTRTTSKAKSVKSPTPARKLTKAKKKKQKNDINAEIDKILAGMYEPKTTKQKPPISKPKRTRELSMKELKRKIGKMVREALKQPRKKLK